MTPLAAPRALPSPSPPLPRPAPAPKSRGIMLRRPAAPPRPSPPAPSRSAPSGWPIRRAATAKGARRERGMKMADAKQKRNEQLKRWIGSETDLEPPVVKRKKTKVKFDDGAVFLAACSSGDTEEVLRLLERGADINYANVDGLTALHQVRAGGGGASRGQGAAAGPSRGWRTGDGAGAPPGGRSAGAASPEGVSPPFPSPSSYGAGVPGAASCCARRSRDRTGKAPARSHGSCRSVGAERGCGAARPVRWEQPEGIRMALFCRGAAARGGGGGNKNGRGCGGRCPEGTLARGRGGGMEGKLAVKKEEPTLSGQQRGKAACAGEGLGCARVPGRPRFLHVHLPGERRPALHSEYLRAPDTAGSWDQALTTRVAFFSAAFCL
ncbi:Protein phosphatase 1 regulatory subunit 12A [Aix galericulata]|nr:Protein phosphatase 1 regulatory subunit 12A [Aix galericulata]